MSRSLLAAVIVFLLGLFGGFYISKLTTGNDLHQLVARSQRLDMTLCRISTDTQAIALGNTSILRELNQQHNHIIRIVVEIAKRQGVDVGNLGNSSSNHSSPGPSSPSSPPPASPKPPKSPPRPSPVPSPTSSPNPLCELLPICDGLLNVSSTHAVEGCSPDAKS